MYPTCKSLPIIKTCLNEKYGRENRITTSKTVGKFFYFLLPTLSTNKQANVIGGRCFFFFSICWNLCLAIQKVFDRHLKPVIGPTS